MEPRKMTPECLGDDDTPMPDNFAKRDSQGGYLRNGDGWDYGPDDNASEL